MPNVTKKNLIIIKYITEELFQKEKNKLLLWIYARRFSSHLWFNGQQKLPVASLN